MKTIVKNRLIPFILILSFIGFYSCEKTDLSSNPDNEYLIFGHYYGECFGEGCIENFKLTKDNLFEDENDYYNQTEFSFNELSNEKFELVKDLIDDFPSQLLEESEMTFGCPDCADQGGLLIGYSEKDDVQYWRLDQSKMNVPEYLHAFMDKVNEKIALINN